MTQSMTAFARGDQQTHIGSYSWEIRSVNSRYLETHFRLPDNLRALETDLRSALRKAISRGKIECTLKFLPDAAGDEFTLNSQLVERINQAAEQVHAIIGPGNALSALDIMKWPGVLVSTPVDCEQIHKEALTLFTQTLQDLTAMRAREGDALNQFILARLDSIQDQVKMVKQALPEILENQKANLLNKFNHLTINLDPERLEQEMVILLQKADVDEELDRIDAHIAEVKRTLSESGAMGRRLDFMMQELNREANTLSSKSLSSDTTQCAVELKVLIEQMREQVQNIE